MASDRLPVVVDNPSTILPASSFPDKSLFEEVEVYPVISVANRDTAAAKTRLQSLIPTRRKCIFEDDDQSRRKIILKPNVDMEQVKLRLSAVVDNHDTTTMKQQSSSKQKKKKKKRNSTGPIEFTIPPLESSTLQLTRTYEEQSTEEILRKLLPTSFEIPSAIEQVGTIAHLNLRPELLPYQHWIGHILIDKNVSIQTVVNKTSHIATIYRTFPMQVIAGNDSTGWSETTVHEHNCTFRLNYQTVYWNSRLAGEHDRLVRDIRSRQYTTVADCMAGIGPFAIPLVKQYRIRVYANDLNQESIKYLKMNKTINHITDDDLLRVYNLDAREFIQTVIAQEPIDCAILNLPASAPEFLDAFAELSLQRLYVYAFAPKNDPTPAVERCRVALGNEHVVLQELDIHTVRDVSAGQNMYCISFRLSNKKAKTK